MAATPKPASRAQVEKQFRDMLLADLPGQVLTTPTMYLAAAPVHPWPQPLCIPGCSPCASLAAAPVHPWLQPLCIQSVCDPTHQGCNPRYTYAYAGAHRSWAWAPPAAGAASADQPRRALIDVGCG